jgi:hypothetical protein
VAAGFAASQQAAGARTHGTTLADRTQARTVVRELSLRELWAWQRKRHEGRRDGP